MCGAERKKVRLPLKFKLQKWKTENGKEESFRCETLGKERMNITELKLKAQERPNIIHR